MKLSFQAHNSNESDQVNGTREKYSEKIINTHLQKTRRERSIEIGVVVDDLHVAAEHGPSALEAARYELKKKDRVLAVRRSNDNIYSRSNRVHRYLLALRDEHSRDALDRLPS